MPIDSKQPTSDSGDNPKPRIAPSKKVARPSSVSREFARPENEDDDGYDAWSDRRPTTPLFEPNPWD